MGPNKNPIDRSNRARGLEKNLKRLNAPKHWLLDKLGGAHPSQRMLASRSYFAKQAKICSHIPDMPLLMESLSFAKFSLGRKASLPYLNTYDGRTIHYPDPLITANYTIKLDPIVDFIKFDAGNVVMLTGGRNRGRKRLAESQTAA
uniref:Ribosomal protein S4e N-terminal domain-containing protein n=1 Tax=Salix viminalis TaxID=40686 RepID=A0A6N2LHA9_SALVM